MNDSLHIYENLIWDILDDRSKIYILTLMIKNEFRGECKITAKVVDNGSVINLKDENGKELDLPLDILDILND